MADRAAAPLVSIVMNCFNGERYLREALDSVGAQSYANWEVIFWDNGSTDGSVEIARRFDPRVRYFRAPETTSLGAARNLALQQGRGDFVAFLDVDDVWLPHTLDRQLSEMARTGCDVVYGGIIFIDDAGRDMGRYVPSMKEGNLFDALLRQFEIYVPAVMVRRAALDRTRLTFDPSIVASEEYCLFMQMAVTCRFCALAEPLAKYRVHDGGLTNRSISKWAVEREYTLDAIVRAHGGIEEQFSGAFAEARARARYYRARYLMTLGDRRSARAELRSAARVGARYFGLWILAMLPAPAWDLVHKRMTGRSVFS